MNERLITTPVRKALVGALLFAAFSAVGTGAAAASPSCIAQGTTAFPAGALGPTISGYARDYVPLGAIVSFEAISPKAACPAE